MAIDFTKPATTDNYSTAFVPGIIANQIALAQMLDSTQTAITGTPPTYAKRYNRSSTASEEYNGTAWAPYALNGITFSGGIASLAGALTATGLITGPDGVAFTAGNVVSNSNAAINILGTNAGVSWQLSNNNQVSGFALTPSTAAGGLTFTTPTLSATPGAVTVGGTLAAAGKLSANSGFSSYTADGLYGGTATPCKFATPSSCATLIGYTDNGSGQYGPAIGLQQLVGAANVAVNASIYISPTGAMVFGGGAANTEQMRLDFSGNHGLQGAGSTYTLGSALQLGRVFSFAHDVNSGYLGAGWMGTNSGSATYAVTGNYAVRQHFDSSGGAIKWYTAPIGTAGGAVTFTQQMTLDAASGLMLGATGGFPTAGGIQLSPSSAAYSYTSHASGTASGIIYAGFNYSSSTIGSISQSGTTAVLYNTTSDRDLKTDRGIVTESDVILRTEIHDFDWNSDGTPGRGVFAQDAYRVKPDAVHVGTDELNEDGIKQHPWGVDYSKYVPDLIVTCQSLSRRLAALEAH